MVSALGDPDLSSSPRRALLALLLSLTIVGAPAAAASGPAVFQKGFVDESLGDISQNWGLKAERLGAGWTRLSVLWALVAPKSPHPGFHASSPADPQYYFAVLDAYVKAATAHHQRVILTAFDAPGWAEQRPPRSAVPGTWNPRASAFGAFAHALAARYSGRFQDPADPRRNLPRVNYFQAWNEPNLFYSLSPQWVRTRRHSWQPASPSIYRGLLNAFYGGVKAAQPHARVLAAGTAPYGDPPGGRRIPPVLFLRELLCLHGNGLRPERCPHPAHADVFDHHPYALTPTRSASANPLDVSVPNLGRLQRIIRRAGRLRRLLPRGSKPLWATEIGWDSNPPDPSPTTLQAQARFVSLSFYELWRQGVGLALWPLLRDPTTPSQHIPAFGVLFASGLPKPSMAAFRFPFTVLAAPRRSVAIWGIAPGSGRVSIQLRTGRSWRTIATVHARAAGGVFYVHRRLKRRAALRAVSGKIASPVAAAP